jgi:hypothetical protein
MPIEPPSAVHRTGGETQLSCSYHAVMLFYCHKGPASEQLLYGAS